MGLAEYLDGLRKQASASVKEEKVQEKKASAEPSDREIADMLYQRISSLDEASIDKIAEIVNGKVAEEKQEEKAEPEVDPAEKLAEEYYAAGNIMGMGFLAALQSASESEKK